MSTKTEDIKASGTAGIPTGEGLGASPCSLSAGNMVVMPAANTGFDCGVFFGRFPDRMGQLFGPEDKNGLPRQEYTWSLDNGVFGAWSKGEEWSEEPLFRFLDKYGFLQPRWVVVPDWVADRDETLRRWDYYAPALQAYGVPLAFVCQDGMTVEDVPSEADVLFVGGSTSWKWRNLRMWTETFPRVHVGRVNTERLLWMADDAGAESCDGTGWFRGDRKQLAGLQRYLEGHRPQMELLSANVKEMPASDADALTDSLRRTNKEKPRGREQVSGINPVPSGWRGTSLLST